MFRHTHPYAVISITDPGDEEAVLTDPKAVTVLRLRFCDVDKRFPRRYPRMTLSQAKEVIRFVRRNQHLSLLLIHCWAGVSRSRGVALALADHFGWAFQTPIYNAHVYKQVRKAAEQLAAPHGARRREDG